MAHNHEQLERAHSICLASHQRIIAAIEFPLAAHELLFSPHIFVRVGILHCAEALKLGTHFGAKPQCAGGGGGGQSDTHMIK